MNLLRLYLKRKKKPTNKSAEERRGSIKKVYPARHSRLTWAFEFKKHSRKEGCEEFKISFLLVQVIAFLKTKLEKNNSKIGNDEEIRQGMRRDCAIFIDITYQLILSDELIKA